MNYKIMIHPMPENCDKCNFLVYCAGYDGSDNVACGTIFYTGILYSGGPLDSDFDYRIERHKNCPLIPAEPWQFETCKTCGTPWNECVVDGIINELSYEATCKLWTAKPAKNGEQNETDNR